MKPLKAAESLGTMTVGVGIVMAVVGWALYSSGASGNDLVADVTLWGGVGLALLGVIVSIGARTVRSWRE